MKRLPMAIKPSATIGGWRSDSPPVVGRLAGKTFVAWGNGVGEGAARVGVRVGSGVRVKVDEGVIA